MAAKRGLYLPLGLRIFLLSAVLILGAVSAAVFVTWRQGEQAGEAAVTAALSSVSRVQARFERQRFNELELEARLIASDSAVVNYLNELSGDDLGIAQEIGLDDRSIPDLLAERREDFGFDFGMVLDYDGNVLGRTDETEAVQESFADDDFVGPVVATGEQVSGYWRMGDELYQAVVAIMAKDDIVVGYLVLADRVDDSLARDIAEFSGAQLVFWSADAGGLARKASSVDSQRAEALALALDAHKAEAMAAIDKGQSIDRLDLDMNNEKWVARLTPLEGGLGATLSLTPADAALGTFELIQRNVLIVGLAAIAIAMLLSWLLSRRILRPVSAMARAAEQAVAGNYAQNLAMRGSDELARLSQAFDSLLSDLREKRDTQEYVGNLARLLPESTGGDTRATSTSSAIEPPRLEALALLAVEYRHFARADRGSAQTALDECAALHRNAQSIVTMLGGRLLASMGARSIYGFSGEAKVYQSLHAAGRILADAGPAGESLAAAVAEGPVVHGSFAIGPRRAFALLGSTQYQIVRLLNEAPNGRVLIARATGDQLRAALGDGLVESYTGALNGKPFYGMGPERLSLLPAPREQSDDDDIGGNATQALAATAPSSGRSPGSNSMRVEPGMVFANRFEILSILGSGGMGVVYKARDMELDDVVALKTLRPGALLDREHLERLKVELKLARRITHPNVLRTHDFGEFDGIPFISMEYVRGMTLRYLLQQTERLPYSAALRIARQLVAGLGAAHDVGVLHRDIKPENLILEQSGNAKLMDFGIARPIRRSDPGHTQPGMFVGTPHYSSPEQLRGEDVDARADIYACGVLLCEMFCGRLPFGGNNTMEIYVAQMQQAPLRPSDVWPEIPPDLDALILKALARDPGERFQSAQDLLVALTALRA